jgi:transketolase
VFEINGNNAEEILAAFEQGKMFPDQPKAIIMKTMAGKGVKFMEGNFRWHGKAPTNEEAEKALWELK